MSSSVLLTGELIYDTDDVILCPVLAVTVQHLEGIGEVPEAHGRLFLAHWRALTHLVPLDLIYGQLSNVSSYLIGHILAGGDLASHGR